MNFFNRAIKNVTRKLSKTILLVLTFLLVGTLVIVGLGVSNAAEQAKVLTRQKMRAVATMEVDTDAYYDYINSLEDEDQINEAYNNYPKVKLSEVQEVLKDSRVKAANALETNTVYISSDLDYVHLNNSMESNSIGGGTECTSDADGNTSCIEYESPTAFIKANYFPNMIEFADGDYNITSGSFYSQEDIDNSKMVCLVSDGFAELNGLKVGDTISLYIVAPSSINASGSWYADANLSLEDVTVELEVIGTFSHNQAITPDSSNYDYTSPYENPDNMILMPGTSYNASSITYEQKLFDYWKTQYPDSEYYQDEANRPSLENTNLVNLYTVTLLLNDPLEVDQFVADYKDSLGEYKTMKVDNEEFNKLAKPLDTLSLYANFIVWLVVINAVIIITLVTALTLKTREYEIGVLLSMGATKFKVVAQFFVELALVALIGFTLSIGTGSLIANKVGQTVLEYQISSSGLNEETDDSYSYTSIWDSDYTTDVSLDDIVSNYNVSISPLIIGEIYVVGLGIVLISILIPSMMIMRFNPKKILMNQN